MSSAQASKKRETSHVGNGVANKKKKPRSAATASAERDQLRQSTGYVPITLSDIRDRISDLCLRLPPIPESRFLLETPPEKQAGNFVDTLAPQPTIASTVDKTLVKKWAFETQAIIEEYTLTVANVSVATYKWGTDRSGAADQNLGLLGTELARSQEMLTTRVAPRLNDVLCPVVATLTSKTVTTKEENGVEVKQNFYTHSYEDVDYVQMCFNSLGRNAPSLRHLLLANWDKVLQALDDYLLAQGKDNDSSRGLY